MAVDLIPVAAAALWATVTYVLVRATGRSEERRPQPKSVAAAENTTEEAPACDLPTS